MAIIRWIGAFILGVFLWYILTFILGFIQGFTGIYLNMSSNFSNFILLPIGIWLGFKITKTRFF